MDMERGYLGATVPTIKPYRPIRRFDRVRPGCRERGALRRRQREQFLSCRHLDVELSTWTEQTPIIHPSNRWCASLSYDPATGYAVLFSGDNNGTLVNDTCAWSGSTWVQQAPSVSPSPRVCAAIKGHLAVSTCVHDHERLTSVYCNLGLVPLPGGV